MPQTESAVMWGGCQAVERVTVATALHEEIGASGWTGGVQTAEHCLGQFRTANERTCQARTQPQLVAPDTPPSFKPRQVTCWIMSHPSQLASGDAASLALLLDTSLRANSRCWPRA